MRSIKPLLLDQNISEIMGSPDPSWWYEGVCTLRFHVPSYPCSLCAALG
jgi:hypothetical protein